jgi:hypothetical protein
MSSQAAHLARCLARDAEAVCRHYLSNGHRRGRYWVVGDVGNTPGRSLFVRLIGPDCGKGAAGKPRRAMGRLLGHGVRFGVVTDVMTAGEGIETMLSVRSALPDLSMVAALSANHLAALLFRATLRRLYVVRDDDPAGDFAVTTLTERAQAAGIEVLTLSPTLGDFNEDLRRLGIGHLRAALRVQLAPEDVPRFLSSI